MNLLFKILKILAGFITFFLLALIITFHFFRFPRIDNPRKAISLGEELRKIKNKVIWVVVAHPDDAEWYAGGLISCLSESNKVVLIMCTSGEKGGNKKDLGRLRESLQEEASKVIGYDEVVFLRFPDRKLKNFESEVFEKLTKLKEKYFPFLIITFDSNYPHFIYRHPDHLAAGRIAEKFAEKYSVSMLLFHTSRPDVVFDYQPWKEKKRKALEILYRYQVQEPPLGVNAFRKLFFAGRKGFSYGVKLSIKEIGLEYGEFFRAVNLNEIRKF